MGQSDCKACGCGFQAPAGRQTPMLETPMLTVAVAAPKTSGRCAMSDDDTAGIPAEIACRTAPADKILCPDAVKELQPHWKAKQGRQQEEARPPAAGAARASRTNMIQMHRVMEDSDPHGLMKSFGRLAELMERAEAQRQRDGTQENCQRGAATAAAELAPAQASP